MMSLLAFKAIPLFGATSYFRTPLSFEYSRWTTVHFPLAWLDNCDNWEVDATGVLFERSACCAYGVDPSCSDECSNSCSSANDNVTRHTVPLAQLWFGQSTFLASDIFAGAQITGTTENPLLPFAQITPRFGYNEKGAVLAFNAIRKNLGCSRDWFVGGRVALPIEVVEVNQRNAGSIVEILPGFSDTIVTIQQQLGGEDLTPAANQGSVDSREVKAYRLDLLTSLQLPDGTPMVQYGTVSGTTATDTFIAGQDITTNVDQHGATATSGKRAPMYAYKQSNGVFPLAKQGLTYALSNFPLSATGQFVYPMINNEADAILTADGGSALADGSFAAFGGANSASTPTNLQQDYAGNLALNNSAQKELFIVPVMISSGATFEPIGLLVQNTIEYVLDSLDLTEQSVIEFFQSRGINLNASDCSSGAGDTFLEFYGGKMCDCWFADALLGFRLPTGTNANEPKRIYQQTTGNNGHFGLIFAVEGGYMPCDWLGIKADFFWEHDFCALEKRAAPFKASTTRNIGPCMDTTVHWDSFQFHVDFTFFSQKCPDLGWDLGYELYAKMNDRVSLCRSTALDFNGNTNLVDPCLLSQNTNTQSHKIRAEVFNRWGCCQIFLGGSYIIAGRQVMKEVECHLGMQAFF